MISKRKTSGRLHSSALTFVLNSKHLQLWSDEHLLTTDETIERIRAYARHMGWPKTRLAREAGLQGTVLRHFDTPRWNPQRQTVQRLIAIIPRSFSKRPTGR